MASIKHTPSGAFQLCAKNRLLPKMLWATFDIREAAEQYGAQLEHLLGQGIVPSALLAETPPKPRDWTVSRCIVEYLRHNAVPESDVRLLDTIRPTLALLATSALSYDWVEAWLASMKRVDHLAPSTIRHRHCRRDGESAGRRSKRRSGHRPCALPIRSVWSALLAAQA